MSRLPHFLHNRLTDGGEVVSLARRPPFTPRKIPGPHFCQWLNQFPGNNPAGRIRSIKKFSYLIGNRTRDLPLCSIVPQHCPYVDAWRKGDTAPHIVNLDIRWRWVVSFMPQAIYPRGRIPWCPLDKRLGAHQSRSGCCDRFPSMHIFSVWTIKEKRKSCP
jgi:hypothetical protein